MLNSDRISAKINDGSWGSLENTGLSGHGWISKLGSIDGRAFCNSQNTLARRNTNGTWTDISPTGISVVNFNTFTVHLGRLYFWYHASDSTEFVASANYGDDWDEPREKYTETDTYLLVSTIPINSTSTDYGTRTFQAIMLATGTETPYNVVVGVIEPAVPVVPVPLTPADTAVVDKDNISFTWDTLGDSGTIHIQISESAGFGTIAYETSTTGIASRPHLVRVLPTTGESDSSQTELGAIIRKSLASRQRQSLAHRL
jgi:hypothetical protein